jgi:sugar phosphate isomerase/epimerase
MFGNPTVPNLEPFMSQMEIQDKLMIAACEEVGPHAASHKTLFMLEPLNRYEQSYLRKQSDGVRIIKASKVKGIGLLSDLFHMHIEETDSPQALREAGKYVSHLHLADNTRWEPGTGDIDLVATMRVLKEINFKGYMAYECGVTGDSPREMAKNLDKSLNYVRDCIAKASA